MPRSELLPDNVLAEKEARVRGLDPDSIELWSKKNDGSASGWVARNAHTGAFMPLLLTNLAVEKGKV